VDPTTQSINVYVTIHPTSGSPIYEGFYVQTEIEGKSLGKAMEVPRQALVGQNEVYVVEGGLLKAKQVNILKTNAETFFFTGLDEQELLVIESIANAKEGMPVSIIPSNAEKAVTLTGNVN
jgi:membrane fusion protein, multidrug efflux system